MENCSHVRFQVLVESAVISPASRQVLSTEEHGKRAIQLFNEIQHVCVKLLTPCTLVRVKQLVLETMGSQVQLCMPMLFAIDQHQIFCIARSAH